MKNKKILLIPLLIIIIVAVIIACCGKKNKKKDDPVNTPVPTVPVETQGYEDPKATPEPPPEFTPHPDSTVTVELTGADSGSTSVTEYDALPGETLKFSFNCEAPLSYVKYTISPNSGSVRTILKDASTETPGTFTHYIGITESMADRVYTVSATGCDKDGGTVVTFNKVKVTVEKKLYDLILTVDGTDHTVRAYDDSYRNDTYICLADVCEALKGSKKSCSLERPSGSVRDASSRWLMVNGEQLRYYSYLHFGQYFSKTLDVCLMADLNLKDSGSGISVNTSEHFKPDLVSLKSGGFFDHLNGILLGNVESGEIYFSSKADSVVPIASVSKLMTWTVLRDDIKSSIISGSADVTVSNDAMAMSLTEDGVYFLQEGKKIPFDELVAAMLLSSSNESAVALACFDSGSEDAFVRKMNKKAAEIGLSSAVFYNCSGVPTFSGKIYSTKVENSMSLNDLFKFVRYLVTNYPEITSFTSKQYYSLPSIGTTATNSNSLLFNMGGITGLKTGTTNRAGYCLVTVAETVPGNSGSHLAALVFGAEDNAERDRISEMLVRYGRER